MKIVFSFLLLLTFIFSGFFHTVHAQNYYSYSSPFYAVQGRVIYTEQPPYTTPGNFCPINVYGRGQEGAILELWGSNLPQPITTKSSLWGYFFFHSVPPGIYNVCLKTPYPAGTTKYCINQIYAFPGETRDPYLVNCARVNVSNQNIYGLRFLLQPVR